MLSAAATGKKILFLTAGITLQEQLIQKDLPALNRSLNLSLPFGLIKGRGNYACLVRAAEALGQTGASEGYISYGDTAKHRTIAEWLKTTERETFPNCPSPRFAAIAGIASSSRSCLGFKCPFRDECFQKGSAGRQGMVSGGQLSPLLYILGAGLTVPCLRYPYMRRAHKIAEVSEIIHVPYRFSGRLCKADAEQGRRRGGQAGGDRDLRWEDSFSAGEIRQNLVVFLNF